MPWMLIIVWILSYFLTKKKTGSASKAALAATAATAGAAYVGTQTEWGQELVGQLTSATTSPDTPQSATTGVSGAAGTAASLGTSLLSTTGEVLKSWGGTGTAAVIGTTALATSSGGVSGFFNKYGFPLLLAAGAYIILK